MFFYVIMGIQTHKSKQVHCKIPLVQASLCTCLRFTMSSLTKITISKHFFYFLYFPEQIFLRRLKGQEAIQKRAPALTKQKSLKREGKKPNNNYKKKEGIPLSTTNVSLLLLMSASLARGASGLPSSSKLTLVPTGLWILIFNFFFFKIRVGGLTKVYKSSDFELLKIIVIFYRYVVHLHNNISYTTKDFNEHKP